MAATGITLAHTPHMRKGGTCKCNLKICSYLVLEFLEILAKKNYYNRYQRMRMRVSDYIGNYEHTRAHKQLSLCVRVCVCIATSAPRT